MVRDTVNTAEGGNQLTKIIRKYRGMGALNLQFSLVFYRNSANAQWCRSLMIVNHF